MIPLSTEYCLIDPSDLVTQVGSKKKIFSAFKKAGGSKAGWRWMNSPGAKVGEHKPRPDPELGA